MVSDEQLREWGLDHLIAGDEPRSGGAGWWGRKLAQARAADEESEQHSAEDDFWPDMTMAEYADWRRQNNMDARGLDRGQVQGMGYRGVSLPETMPGADHVRAAQILAAEGDAARRDANMRQWQAANTLYGRHRPAQ